ncbi:Uncharacterised protein [Bordetella pertussis]|nr:Uncharacterised protein [Bordetella pertussis]CFW47301.1 Uncharacterised protein [Bordetella pertussis]
MPSRSSRAAMAGGPICPAASPPCARAATSTDSNTRKWTSAGRPCGR